MPAPNAAIPAPIAPIVEIFKMVKISKFQIPDFGFLISDASFHVGILNYASVVASPEYGIRNSS
jgi:hypothetical protein